MSDAILWFSGFFIGIGVGRLGVAAIRLHLRPGSHKARGAGMSANARRPAEVWPIGYFLAEEMIERGWTSRDVAARMDGDFGVNAIAVDFYLAIADERLKFGFEQAKELADAFDVSPEYLMNLHRTWVENPQARQEWECPEHLFAGSAPTEH